jgi:hypothetical protein
MTEVIVNNTHVRFSPKKLVLVLTGIATFLAIQSIVLRALQYWVGIHNTYWLYQYSELMNINREANVPTWFSSAILLSAAVLLLVVTLSTRANGRPFIGWAGLTAIFTYISIDETGTIHEKLTPIMQEQLELTGYLFFGWVVVGIVLVVAVGLIYLPFVWRLPAVVRNRFILAGALYVGGAIGVESISANLWYLGGGTSLAFSAVGTVEEWMEMVGIITLIYGLLVYIRSEVGVVQFSVSGAETVAERSLAASERPKEIPAFGRQTIQSTGK